MYSESKIVASDGDIDDRFGKSVALSNNWLVIGANRDDDSGDNSGSIYLYEYENSEIISEHKIIPYDGDDNDYFGKALALDGQWLAVTSLYDDINGEKSGSAYIYKLEDNQWNFHSKLDPDDGAPLDRFGYSIDIHDDTIVIGSVYDDDYGQNSGSVYVYELNDDIWTFKSKLNSVYQLEEDFFGVSVAVHGNIIAVGSVYDDNGGNNAGSVSIFKNENNTWIEYSILTATDSQDYDFFGNAIDLNNQRLAIGAFHDDNIYQNSGSVYIYNINENIEFSYKISAYDESINDNFGQSISIYENFLAAGSINDDNGTNSGALYIYELGDLNIINSVKHTPNDVTEYDEFSGSVSIYANNILVGAQFDDDLGNESGSAYLIRYLGCSDIQACNYNNEYLLDGLFCDYPENGFNCDGECFETIDECNVCGGNGVDGDVNFDNAINIVDIIIIIDFILNSIDNLNICTSDLNYDININITDIILLIEQILNQ